MNKTTIEWTDYTWNPVTGCNKVSAGCKNCYAENVATRFWGDRDFTHVRMHEDRLNEPKKNKKKWAGKKVFVCSMSDLFHEVVHFRFLLDVFVSMAECADTTFQILTKRPERALKFFEWVKYAKPTKNIWIGVSCENQATADERIPLLLQIPAAVRFLSCEPLLGKIDLVKYLWYPDPNGFLTDFIPTNKIHWVIAGGESGHKARPMHPGWVRSLRDQCAAANVPFFFKQWGEWCDHGNSTKFVSIQDQIMYRVGKSKSGNLLDGVEHKAFPVMK
jgi:protein gp37